MRRNSRLRRIFFLTWAYPPNKWFLTSFVVLMALWSMTGNILSIFLFVIAIAGYLAISSKRSIGRIPWLTNRISPNFYFIRALSGRRVIFEVQPEGRASCREIRKSLVAEKDLLDTLSPGRYRAITHDTAIARITASPRTTITKRSPAYRADLRRTLASLSGGRCRSCQGKCRAWNLPARQFYDVCFTVKQ